MVHQSASTVVGALVQGVRWVTEYASTAVSATQCKECGGSSHMRARSCALYMQGVRWVINLRARSSALSSARSAAGHICEHGRQRYRCKECGGSGICEHGRRRSSVQGVQEVANVSSIKRTSHSRRVYIVNTHTHKYDIYSTFDGPVLVSRRLKVWLKVPIIFEPRGNLAFTHLTI